MMLKHIYIWLLLLCGIGGYAQMFKDQDSVKLKREEYGIVSKNTDTITIFYADKKANQAKQTKKWSTWKDIDNKKVDGGGFTPVSYTGNLPTAPVII